MDDAFFQPEHFVEAAVCDIKGGKEGTGWAEIYPRSPPSYLQVWSAK
jgi:hypothetical protein